MKLDLRPKGIPRDTPPPPLTKGGVVVGMKKEGDKEKIYLWLSLLVSHPKVLKMGQHIVQNKGMTPKREKMRHVKETEDAPE